MDWFSVLLILLVVAMFMPELVLLILLVVGIIVLAPIWIPALLVYYFMEAHKHIS